MACPEHVLGAQRTPIGDRMEQALAEARREQLQQGDILMSASECDGLASVAPGPQGMYDADPRTPSNLFPLGALLQERTGMCICASMAGVGGLGYCDVTALPVHADAAMAMDFFPADPEQAGTAKVSSDVTYAAVMTDEQEDAGRS